MTASTRDPLTAEKTRLRAELRAAREAMSARDRARQADDVRAALIDHLTGHVARNRQTVAAYLGVGTEPDTDPLLEALHEAGVDVVVPVCEPHRALSWVRWWPGVAVARSGLAPVDEPTGPRLSFAELADVRLVLVPALAVDRSGRRLGQGGGYYDRFLAQLGGADGPSPIPVVAVVYRTEVLAVGAVPSGPLDRAVDAVLTADGVIPVGAPSGAPAV